MATQVFNRFGDDAESKFPVKAITLPDLSIPMQLGRRQPFSLFIPAHRKIAARLIDIFMGIFFLPIFYFFCFFFINYFQIIIMKTIIMKFDLFIVELFIN